MVVSYLSGTEASNTTYPKPTGSMTVYLQTNKVGTQVEWIQFAE